MFPVLFDRFQLENETSFTTKKGRSVDNSIARAFTAAIRRAKRFIYIENQVRFLPSMPTNDSINNKSYILRHIDIFKDLKLV